MSLMVSRHRQTDAPVHAGLGYNDLGSAKRDILHDRRQRMVLPYHHGR
ncbi:MAG: hypothetical protein IPO35_00720 [Uliginosibacterium sp.]|nr:hypothetical protein [Uliginosibacterium sp.]